MLLQKCKCFEEISVETEDEDMNGTDGLSEGDSTSVYSSSETENSEDEMSTMDSVDIDILLGTELDL